LEGVQWPALLALSRRNRVAALAQAALSGRAGVPRDARDELLALARRSFVETALTAQALGEVAPALAALPWALLRGPALGANLYGDLMLRPYGDLDVLVEPAHVNAAQAALGTLGFCLPPGSPGQNYYRAFHLHLPLTRPGLAGPLALELHWAIDHPFSLYTVDVAGLLARRRELTVEQVAVPAPAPDDLVLTLAVHAVKHAVQLPFWLETDRVEQVVEEGCLLSLFDIALALQVLKADLDWEQMAGRAKAWGAAAQVRACLDAIEGFWPGMVSKADRLRFARGGVSRFQRAAFGGGLAPGRPHAEFYRLRRGMFFRPVRTLDAFRHVLAPADYLKRRYGSAGPMRRIRHALSALGRLAAGFATLAYWSAGQGLARAFRASPRE
jgi:hypothetical protein